MSDIKKTANKVRSKLKSESGLQALSGIWGALQACFPPHSPWNFTDSEGYIGSCFPLCAIYSAATWQGLFVPGSGLGLGTHA